MISDINIRVNRDLCYACGICVERCIMDNLRLSVAPCRQACPLHMNAQGYIRLLALGKLEAALREMDPYFPFIGILGRVCHHPCEETCARASVDGAVCIRALKKYMADRIPDLHVQPPSAEADTGKSVAIVGSGPAGLMAAYCLRRQGHRVTVLESEPQAGGHLRYSIPSFRLPVSEVDRCIQVLDEMGIIFQTGTTLGRDTDLDRLEAHFHAVTLAFGGGISKSADLPGLEPSSTFDALELLRQVKRGEQPTVGNSVVVVGGGNTAVDTAITCRYLGAETVRIACLEDPAEMPAFKMELDHAREEGIIFEHRWGPSGIVTQKDGSFELELSRCVSIYDNGGNFAPKLEPFCGLRLKADTVLTAFGFQPDHNFLPEDALRRDSGMLKADAETLACLSRPKVFVCGDCFTGPTSVAHALASGQEAAISVDRFLRGEGLRWGRGFWTGACVSDYEVLPDRAVGGPRPALPRIPLDKRKLTIEVEPTFSGEIARREAERCLSCGRSFEMNHTCWYCLPCEIECPVDALEVRLPYLVR